MRWYRGVDALDKLAQPIRSLELQTEDARDWKVGRILEPYAEEDLEDVPKRSPGRRPFRGAPNLDRCL